MKKFYQLILFVLKDLIDCKNLIKSLTLKERLEIAKIICFGLLVNGIYGVSSGKIQDLVLIVFAIYAIIKVLKAERS